MGRSIPSSLDSCPRARLTALAGRLKTSLDDMFTLLVAVGEDCVGDVSVVPTGLSPSAPAPFAAGDPSELDFGRLFEQSVGEGPAFDRVQVGRSPLLMKTHQEDACQFTNVFPAAKYRLTSRDVAEGLVEHASVPPLAIRELVRQSAANYLIANGDFHGKNLSLYRAPARQSSRSRPPTMC